MAKQKWEKETDKDEIESQLAEANSKIFDLEIKLFRKDNELREKIPNLTLLTLLLDDPNILEKVLREKKTLSEVLHEDNYFKKSIVHDEALIKLVNAFSRNIDTVLRSGYTRNPDIGKDSKKKADGFAENMGKYLTKVRDEGFTSTRAIAKRFNELGIKSARGNEWSHTTVNQLIHRRDNLGLENNNPENPTAE